jgi:hypothetical protein
MAVPAGADPCEMARILGLLAAVGVFGAACVAVLAATAVDWLACENEGTPACARQDLASTQQMVALVGLVPAVVLIVAAALGKRRLALLALAIGVPLYLAWAVLLDAAVHGWDDLNIVP